MIRRFLPKSTEQLIHWYERYISPLSLVAGFLSDNLFLLKRVDLFRTNALLFFYLIMSALGIVLINMLETGRMKQKWMLKTAPFIPLVVQFCFGGLFSGYLSLYSRSASVAVSWIFVALLTVLLLFNERFSRFYVRFPVQIGLYFLVLISFLEFFLPVVLHAIGPAIFFLSGVTSLVVIALFIALMRKLVPDVFRESGKRAIASVGVIFVLFNILYFTNVIPPLPLALKSAGVYHSITHKNGVYTLEGEPLAWYQEYLNYAPVFHKTPGETVFVFSSIFAPSGLSTEILHQWQFYDTATKKWVTKFTVSYPIEGGRDGGYQGYSEALDPADGQWRVNVVTQYGQLIGRISFSVESVQTPVPLVASTP